MPSMPVYRPEWAYRARFTRPPGGFHLVDATQRWHLYQSHGVAIGLADAIAVVRWCDDASSTHDRLPTFVHGDAIELKAGQSVCPACWHAWEQLLALPAIL